MARTYDIMASENYQDEIVWRLSNKKITGILKAIQVFNIKLLTAFGSKTIDPNDGSSLFDALYSSNMPAEQLAHHVHIAVDETMSQIKEDQIGLGYDDEKIREVNIVKVTKTGTRAEVTLEITTEAGTSVDFLLPISTI